jgi:hypothetical protein
MSLAAVCVDRGRILRKEPTGVRLEGRTSFTQVPQQWFKCRLFLTQSMDQVDPAGLHTSNVSSPQVLTVARDLDRQPLVFQGDFYIEITSAQFGRAVWQMQGEPEPLRKKRRVIGWLLFTQQVIERQYDDLFGEAVPALGPPGV